MVRKGIGFFTFDKEFLGVLHVLRESCLHVLLGVTDVLLAGCQAGCFIDYNRVPAFSQKGTSLLVPAVAVEVLEIK
jgi:hypothetical protein